MAIEFGNGIQGTFRSTAVHIYNGPGPDIADEPHRAVDTPPIPAAGTPTAPMRRGRGRPRKVPSPEFASVTGTTGAIYLTAPMPSPSSEHSRRPEIFGLLEKWVFAGQTWSFG
ncbi:hypothetical protein SEPCBS119000_006037 [Sporothrix epigloea]|uniref:Uncharacterized protein n=1 Tax=Sporothrix epigloea TaxID=1892477 RepID=A0ABP0E0T3_9PEZI